MLSVRLPVNSRLLVVKFWGSQKLYMDFQLCGVSASLAPMLFKGQLYTVTIIILNKQKSISWIENNKKIYFILP